jgi:hypothetical protein
MSKPNLEQTPSTLELRFKRWTAVGVVCFLGLLAALPFRSTPSAPSQPVAASHRERSLRFRAEDAEPKLHERDGGIRPAPVAPRTEHPSSISSARAAKSAAESSLPKAAVELVGNESPPAVPGGAESEPTPVESEWRTKSPLVEPKAPRTCVALRGENLMDVAERALGDRSRSGELIELNPAIRSKFEELAEGAEVLLPAEK